MAWIFDAPSGTYRNRALSDEIRHESIANTQTMQFLRAESGFGKGKGQSYTITRILKLPMATRISETDMLPSGRPAIQTKDVSISQWGFKIPITELERHLTHFDPMDEFQKNLMDQIKLTMDDMAADAFKQTPIKYVPTVAGQTVTTNGTPSGTATRNLGVQDLRYIHDYLHGTLKCPTYSNGKYVGILSTQAARGLKNDPEYARWFSPHTKEPLISGKLPVDLEGFDLYETNHTDVWQSNVGASTTTGEAMFFGGDSAGLLEVMAPEVRVGIPEDLGRFQQVGWVGTLEAFLTWEQASYARAIHFTSA